MNGLEMNFGLAARCRSPKEALPNMRCLLRQKMRHNQYEREVLEGCMPTCEQRQRVRRMKK